MSWALTSWHLTSDLTASGTPPKNNRRKFSKGENLYGWLTHENTMKIDLIVVCFVVCIVKMRIWVSQHWCTGSQQSADQHSNPLSAITAIKQQQKNTGGGDLINFKNTHADKQSAENKSDQACLSLSLFLHLLFLGVCLLQTMAALHWELYIGMMDEGICLTQGPVFSIPMPMSAHHSSALMVIHTNDNKRQRKVTRSLHNSESQRKKTDVKENQNYRSEDRGKNLAWDWRVAMLKRGKESWGKGKLCTFHLSCCSCGVIKPKTPFVELCRG